MKILITGHKGFIGKKLWERLLNFNYELIGYDLEDGNDIRDYFKLDKLFRENQISIVIHLAARAGVRTGQEFPDEYISTNVNGTNNLIRCAEKYNIEHFIFFSSSSVYGKKKPPNCENDKLDPQSIYAITKFTGELLIRNAKIKQKTIIRPFTVYGEDGRQDQVVYKWLNQIKASKPITFYGDGNTKRGYTYVGDLVIGIENLLRGNDIKTRKKTEIYNLGGNEVIELKKLLDVFKVYFPDIQVNKMELPNCDVEENWANISKAQKCLGFNPNTNFELKVSEIINSFKMKNYV